MTDDFARREIEITILKPSGREQVKLDAQVLGVFAVHASHGMRLVSGRPAFVITHLPTGGLITADMAFDTADEAKAAVRVFLSFPVDWTMSAPGAFKEVPYLRETVMAVAALCNAFEFDYPMEGPGGHA